MQPLIPTSPARDVYSVARLVSEIRFILEGNLPMVWVEGEISGLARPASGHLYFSLKDGSAQLRCAMFRQRGRLLRFRPENGQRVRLRVRVTVYEQRGDMQLLVEHMEAAGDGALMLAFEALKAKLQAEGLFDAERKRPLPDSIQRIGLITSPSGAVLHDICNVLQRRYPAMALVLYPVLVQGAEAPAQIIQALELANQRREVDLLIVARGGGSLEDLQAFNHEGVARAIADSSLMVVSAVGHEVDFTIADLVADLRAPTPSAAAELVSPDQRQQREQIAQLLRRLQRAGEAHLGGYRQQLDAQHARLLRLHPGRRLEQNAQRLDELELRLQRAQQQQLQRGAQRLEHAKARLRQQSPAPLLRQHYQHHHDLRQRLVNAMQHRLELAEQRLANQAHALHTVSPLATLGRGYAIVRDEHGAIVHSAHQLEPESRVTTRLGEGCIHCRVESIEESCP